MVVVPRRTLWFHAANAPYVDFEFKGNQFFFDFKKSLTICYPHDRKPALWPGGPEAAAEDGIDLVVPEWSWWLIADDTLELSCSHHGILGNFLAYYDGTTGTQITIPVTIAEARALREAVEAMIGEARAGGELFDRNRDLRVLKPNKKVIAYPVKAYQWTRPRKAQSDPHKHVWNPRGMV